MEKEIKFKAHDNELTGCFHYNGKTLGFRLGKEFLNLWLENNDIMTFKSILDGEVDEAVQRVLDKEMKLFYHITPDKIAITRSR